MRLAALIAALLLASPALSQTLHGGNIQLHGGSFIPAATAVMESASGTLRLERATLGELAAGRSTGRSGLQLQGGVVTLPEPHWGLLAGLGLLSRLGGRSSVNVIRRGSARILRANRSV